MKGLVEVIYEDYLLALVAIPPLVGILPEKVGVLLSDTSRLSCASRSVMPLVL